jgi:serine/threonine-protein kinase
MSDLEVGREIAGRYRVVRFIGRGGMGAVYEVEHLHTGQHLAMKVLTAQHHATTVERFKREARAASRIQSDHVVRVTDADVAAELDGAPFLVMELLEGADLERSTSGRLPSREEVLEWLRQVGRALTKAHEAGIVHRDLKPENLFLTQREDGTALVKILDFGIAKLTAEAGGLTQSDQFLGTPAYMAPEQAESHGALVTSSADVYSLGLIAFRLLVGKTYWRSGSLAQILAQILVEPMVPASERGSELGPGFDAWFAKSTAREPAHRHASATEQVEALAEALGLPLQRHTITPAQPQPLSTLESAPTVTPETPPTLGASSREMTTARTRRSRGPWVAGAVAAALGLGAVVVVGTARRSAEPSPSRGADSLSAAGAQTSLATVATVAPSVVEARVPPSTTTTGASSAASSVTDHPPPAIALSATRGRSMARPAPSSSSASAAGRHPDAGTNPLDGQY